MPSAVGCGPVCTQTPTTSNARLHVLGTDVVSVSGPKMYRLDAVPEALPERVAEGIQLYQVITIDGPALYYEARTATGELYDAFTLRKRPGQRNELTDRIPDTPTRRLRTEEGQP